MTVKHLQYSRVPSETPANAFRAAVDSPVFTAAAKVLKATAVLAPTFGAGNPMSKFASGSFEQALRTYRHTSVAIVCVLHAQLGFDGHVRAYVLAYTCASVRACACVLACVAHVCIPLLQACLTSTVCPLMATSLA